MVRRKKIKEKNQKTKPPPPQMDMTNSDKEILKKKFLKSKILYKDTHLQN